ncbi:MAG: hypothetical protein HOE62_14165 [Alphaproteobacteria bacterium]|nr:hypothetical protein [Alphaproteobacteria bacterium]
MTDQPSLFCDEALPRHFEAVEAVESDGAAQNRHNHLLGTWGEHFVMAAINGAGYHCVEGYEKGPDDIYWCLAGRRPLRVQVKATSRVALRGRGAVTPSYLFTTDFSPIAYDIVACVAHDIEMIAWFFGHEFFGDKAQIYPPGFASLYRKANALGCMDEYPIDRILPAIEAEESMEPRVFGI